MSTQPSPRIPFRPGSLSLLAFLGAGAMVLLGAALFSQAMSMQVLHVAVQVALNDQLNSATFLSKEIEQELFTQRPVQHTIPATLSLPAGPVAWESTNWVERIGEIFDTFTSRHRLQAYLIDMRTLEPVLQSAPPFATDLPFQMHPTLRKVYGDGPLNHALGMRVKLQGLVGEPGERYLATLAPVAGTPLTLVVYRPEAPLLSTAGELTHRFTSYLLAACTIVLVLFVLFMRTITQPLRVLTNAARRIGAGQLDQLVEVRSHTEVGVLADAFNQMAQELRSKYQELASATGRLEESNRRYREILIDYEQQNAELTLLNQLVYEAARSSNAAQNLEPLIQGIQHGFGLTAVALYTWRPRQGWDLAQASDPLFATCDVQAGGLLDELRRLARHRKVRLTRAERLGPSRGNTYAQRFEGGALCLVPVVVQGQLEAAFVLAAPGHRTFSRTAVQRFVRLTQQLGILLHKDQLLAETQRRREQLEQIHSLGSALLSALDFDTLIPRLLGELNGFLGADQAVLCLVDATSGLLEPVTAVEAGGPVTAFLHQRELDWNQRILETGEPVLIREYPRLDLWQPGPAFDPSRTTRFQSYLGLPLQEGGRIIGVLALLAEQPGCFDHDDVQFLSTFANQLSAAVCNARLFQELSHRDERRNVQLATAKQFQSGRIPTSYDDGCVEVRASLLPAEELAGDFFDVVRLSPNLTGLVIGDVASKGIAASLLTFSMLSIFRNFAAAMRPPAKVMDLANETIRAQLDDDFWFVTAFYARINHADLTLTYCKAGHVMPVLYHAADSSCELLDGEGLPLGILDEPEYIGGQAELAPGDRLVLYTDGVTEIKNEQGEQFGVDRLCAVIAAHGQEPAEAIRAAILAALDAWAPGAKRDDILLAVVGLLENAWIHQEIRYADMEDLIEKVMGEIRSFPVNATTLYAVRLALNETIANANLHGNAANPDAPIWVSYHITSSYFALQVRDTGPGFDYENLPDPTVPENLIRTHGRGIFLMRQLMDELEFNEVGNEIRLRKYFTFETAQSAAAALRESRHVKNGVKASPAALRALSGAME